VYSPTIGVRRHGILSWLVVSSIEEANAPRTASWRVTTSGQRAKRRLAFSTTYQEELPARRVGAAAVEPWGDGHEAGESTGKLGPASALKAWMGSR
jgi:hypothetical protein